MLAADRLRETGNYYFIKNNFEGALLYYKLALMADNNDWSPKNAPLHASIAQGLFHQQKFKEAEEHARKAVALDVDSEKGYYIAARAAEKLGDCVKALRFLQIAFERPKLAQNVDLLRFKAHLDYRIEHGFVRDEVKEEVIGNHKTVINKALKQEQLPVFPTKTGSITAVQPAAKERPMEIDDTKFDTFIKLAQTTTKEQEAKKIFSIGQTKLKGKKTDYEQAIHEAAELLLKRKQNVTAALKYQEALDIILEYPAESMGLPSITETVLKYCIVICWCKSVHVTLEQMTRAVEYLAKIRKVHPAERFPAVFYGYAKVYSKLNRFQRSKELAEAGLEVLKTEPLLQTNLWPGSIKEITETTRSGLEKSLRQMIVKGSVYHPPDATCRNSESECFRLSKQIIPSQLIYYSDVDFHGFMEVRCESKCVIEYHISCWRDYKEKQSELHGNKLTDKDILGLLCPTEDCTTPKGEISTIIYIAQLFDQRRPKFTVEKEATKDKAPKKKMESTKASSPSKSNVGARPKSSGRIPPAEKLPQTANVDCTLIDDARALNAAVENFVELRKQNFNYRKSQIWDISKPFYGRSDLATGDYFRTPRKGDHSRDFVLSYFQEMLLQCTQMLVADVEELWTESTEKIPEFFKLEKDESFPGIINYLTESYQFVVIGDTMCLANDLEAIFSQCQLDATEAVQFLIEEDTKMHGGGGPLTGLDLERTSSEISLPLATNRSRSRLNSVVSMFSDDGGGGAMCLDLLRETEVGETRSEIGKVDPVDDGENIKEVDVTSQKRTKSRKKKFVDLSVGLPAPVFVNNHEVHDRKVHIKSPVEFCNDVETPKVNVEQCGFVFGSVDMSKVTLYGEKELDESIDNVLKVREMSGKTDFNEEFFTGLKMINDIPEEETKEIIDSQILSEMQVEVEISRQEAALGQEILVAATFATPMDAPGRKEETTEEMLKSVDVSNKSTNTDEFLNDVESCAKPQVSDEESQTDLRASSISANEAKIASLTKELDLMFLRVKNSDDITSVFLANRKELELRNSELETLINRKDEEIASLTKTRADKNQIEDKSKYLSLEKTNRDLDDANKEIKVLLAELEDSRRDLAVELEKAREENLASRLQLDVMKEKLETSEASQKSTRRALDVANGDLEIIRQGVALLENEFTLLKSTKENLTALNSKASGKAAKLEKDNAKLLAENKQNRALLQEANLMLEVVREDSIAVKEERDRFGKMLDERAEMKDAGNHLPDVLRSKLELANSTNNLLQTRLAASQHEVDTLTKRMNILASGRSATIDSTELFYRFVMVHKELGEIKAYRCEVEFARVLKLLDDAQEDCRVSEDTKQKLWEMRANLGESYEELLQRNGQNVTVWNELLNNPSKVGCIDDLPPMCASKISDEVYAALFDIEENCVEESERSALPKPEGPLRKDRRGESQHMSLQNAPNRFMSLPPPFVPPPFAAQFAARGLPQGYPGPYPLFLPVNNFHQHGNNYGGSRPNRPGGNPLQGAPVFARQHPNQMMGPNLVHLLNRPASTGPQLPNVGGARPKRSASQSSVNSVDSDKSQKSNATTSTLTKRSRPSAGVGHTLVDMSVKTCSYESLVNILCARFPNVPTIELVESLEDIRTANNGSLRGCTPPLIIKKVGEMLHSKSQKPAWAPVAAADPDGSEKWRNPFDDSECAICMDLMSVPYTTTLPCDHIFHRRCIKKWLSINSVCPTCKRHTKMDDEYPPLK